ncbi:NUDIX hydrolase [Alcanivorax sp.]|uniref:NUDIX hydrolase n=1 Tax=Alcanivorax sp. TaxID=1872427 RepID=UPI003A9441FF
MNVARVMGYRARPLPMTPSPSAVALLLVNGQEASRILLLKRPERMRAYAGDWCLPGGRQDASDAHLEDTMWRELEEETGLKPHHSRLLACLDDFYNGRGQLVRPFLIGIDQADFSSHLALQEDEVADYECLPLSRLSDLKQGTPEGMTSRRSPGYYLEFGKGIETQVVWGLTATVLAHLHNVHFETAWAIDHGDNFGIVRKGESDGHQGRAV